MDLHTVYRKIVRHTAQKSIKYTQNNFLMARLCLHSVVFDDFDPGIKRVGDIMKVSIVAFTFPEYGRIPTRSLKNFRA